MGPLETLRSGFDGWVRNAKMHLAGRGVMSGATMLAFAISTIFKTNFVPFVVALGGVGLHMFHRLRHQWAYQDAMAEKYRGEIADRLGIAPETVTREHVKLVAYGSEKDGIEGNPIMREALERQRSKSWLVFGTALAAAVVTFMLLSFSSTFVAGALLQMAPVLSNVPLIPNALGMVSGVVIAGLSSIFVQDGLELVIGNAKGINAPAAHDRILAIEARQARGKSVTPEQIFQVKLAASPELEERVIAMAGRKFSSLKADMQERVLARIDVKGEMLMLAEEINKKHIDAKELAFILVGQQPVHQSRAERKQEEPAPTVEHKPSFAERLGFKPKEHASSHVDRIDESRVVPIESARR